MGNIFNGFGHKFKSFVGLGSEDEYNEYEDEDEGYEEEVGEEDEDETSDLMMTAKNKKSNKIVKIHTSTAVKVTITKPENYEEAQNICEALKDRRIVLVNMSALNRETKEAQRLLDFMSGACYALDGELEKIEKGVYLLAPANVEITNELKKELDNKAIFNLIGK